MRHRFLVVLLVVLLLPLQVLAQQVQGRVIGISDGDTFKLLAAGNQQIKVRLAEIDTPESKQPYGNKAKQELSSLIFGKTVTVTIVDTDRYGRAHGRPGVRGQHGRQCRNDPTRRSVGLSEIRQGSNPVPTRNPSQTGKTRTLEPARQ
jgi:endonuclease YncB( thermonuclease family)